MTMANTWGKQMGGVKASSTNTLIKNMNKQNKNTNLVELLHYHVS